MTSSTAVVANEAAAHDLLRAAHDAGYRFPANFAGFTADARATETTDAGTSTITGTVTVSGPRATELETAGGNDLANWTRQEIASMAGHRWNTPYAEGDGRWTLTLADDADSVLGQTVVVHDDPFSSRYRVRDGRIAQVIRTMGATSFTISIQRHLLTADGRALPADFTVSYWDTEAGRLTRTDSYADTYADIDGVSLPLGRRVVTASDDGFVGRQFELTDVRMLTRTDAS